MASNFRMKMSKIGKPISEVSKTDMISNMDQITKLVQTSDPKKKPTPALIQHEQLLKERHKHENLADFFQNKIHELCDQGGLNLLSDIFNEVNKKYCGNSNGKSNFQ